MSCVVLDLSDRRIERLTRLTYLPMMLTYSLTDGLMSSGFVDIIIKCGSLRALGAGRQVGVRRRGLA